MRRAPISAFNLQEYLPYRLSVAASVVSKLIARAYEHNFGLTVPQWRLIAILASEGTLNQQSLCDRTIMDKVTVMRAAKGLVRRRLLIRLPNSQDGRSHCLRLSKSGHDLFEQVAPLALEYESHLVSNLKKTEVEALHRLLRLLERAATTRTSPAAS